MNFIHTFLLLLYHTCPIFEEYIVIMVNKVMREVPDEQGLPTYMNQAQQVFITQKTPEHFIKTRPGPGGVPVKYVEVGYVINMLNQAFGWDWDYEIVDHQIGKRQVWIQGKLTVRIGQHSIIKTQYGGAEIKLNRNGEIISIADDLKAAASDGLKKCASMLGIAADVYWENLENWDKEMANDFGGGGRDNNQAEIASS